jgi:hypothetical protein
MQKPRLLDQAGPSSVFVITAVVLKVPMFPG